MLIMITILIVFPIIALCTQKAHESLAVDPSIIRSTRLDAIVSIVLIFLGILAPKFRRPRTTRMLLFVCCLFAVLLHSIFSVKLVSLVVNPPYESKPNLDEMAKMGYRFAINKQRFVYTERIHSTKQFSHLNFNGTLICETITTCMNESQRDR